MIKPNNTAALPKLGGRQGGKKFMVSITAMSLAAAMAMPGAAWAAEKVYVDGTEYDSSASGAGWSWDGEDDMVLDGYNGGAIAAEGDLNITLKGQNAVSDSTEGQDYQGMTAIDVWQSSEQEGNLTITGAEGSLVVNAEHGYGIYVYEHDLTIEDTDVTVNVTGTGYAQGIKAGDDVTISDAKVKVTTDTTGWVDDDGNAGECTEYGIAGGQTVTIANSDVTVTGSGADKGAGISAESEAYVEFDGEGNATIVEGGASQVAIKGANVVVSGFADAAISSLTTTYDNDTYEQVNGDAEVKGTIVLDHSAIETPDGAAVQDVDYTVFEDWGEWGTYEQNYCGQVIGTDDGAATLDLTIVATEDAEGDGNGGSDDGDSEGTGEGTGTGIDGDNAEGNDGDSEGSDGEATDDDAKSEASTSKSGIPQTGDTSAAGLAVAGVGIAGMVAAIAALVRRKMML